MAGDSPTDPAKALECKEKGNKCFQAGDYGGAEALYTKAINYDPTNPLLYTNRTLTLLRLHLYPRVIDDALTSIKLLPENMKAYYHLAQAQIALHQTAEALESSKQAHRYCVEEIYRGGKGGSSIGPITELVLKCKKEWWEEKEEARLKVMPGLLNELIGGLEQKKKWAIKEAIERNSAPDGIMLEEEVKAVIERQYAAKVEELRHTFDLAGTSGAEGKRRKVPDWCVDDISFAVMLDPVVTKTGQSYDRSSIMEHLKRSPTDPLTREPLRMEDLRPNLALKAACEEFLKENGWAVDW